MIEAEKDWAERFPSALRYLDAIDVLRGTETKMECEGWCEREAEVDDSDLEDTGLGRVIVRRSAGSGT